MLFGSPDSQVPSQSGWESDDEVKPSEGTFFDVADLLAGFSSPKRTGSSATALSGVQRSEPSLIGSERSMSQSVALTPIDDLLGGGFDTTAPPSSVQVLPPLLAIEALRS